MITLKGFVTISQYINNAPGETSPLGELSTWSMTYTKERGEYSNANIPGYKLHTFKSVDESNLKVSVPDNQVEQILQIVQECINYATTHIRPYNPIDFSNTILGSFFGRISNLTYGEFVDNGSLALPEFITWVSNEYNNNVIKIWLADESFKSQYDEYEINVVPPLTPLDNFFGFYNQAVSDVTARTFTDLTNDIQTLKGDHPETYMRLMGFDYVNQNNPSQRTATTWAVLIYGRAGDHIDIIRDEIVRFILANSSYARPEWSVIFPDIFKRTEFIILPRWDKLSIPNLQVSAALYSSLLDPVECVSFALQAFDFYPPAWIEDNITIMPFDFKALSLLVINGYDNVAENATIAGIFPDYIPVSSTSLDFNRMTVKTREWLLILEQLLITAETATEYNSIPDSVRRIDRNGIMFISAVYENVNYMVAAKQNFMYA